MTQTTTLNERQVELLRGGNLAILATVRQDGTPQLTPVWVDWDGEHVLINTAEHREKSKNIRRNPTASVCVVDRNDPDNWLSITGTAQLTHEGAEAQLHDVARKYTGEDFSVRPGQQRVIVKIAPEPVNPQS